MSEKAFREDIIAGFGLIIAGWCKGCQKQNCRGCLKFEAAKQGHLNMIKEWATS